MWRLRAPPPEELLFLNGGELRSEAKLMASIEDFRIKSHELLIELDAATMGMMTLVSSKCVSGPDWVFATKRQHDAYKNLGAFMNAPTAVIQIADSENDFLTR